MITIAPGTDPELTLTLPSLTRFLNRARAAVDLQGNVDVLLTTDADLKRLNRTFRHQNKSTDILSFPAAPNPLPHSIAKPDLSPALLHAGDLAISLDTAARQAAHFGHPLATELRILLLHGLLHLHGLDHETDTGEMATRESHLRIRFRLPNTLIDRTQSPRPTPLRAPSRTSASSAVKPSLRPAPKAPAPPASSFKKRGRP